MAALFVQHGFASDADKPHTILVQSRRCKACGLLLCVRVLQLVYQGEALVDLLVHCRCHHYVEFKAVDGWCASCVCYMGALCRAVFTLIRSSAEPAHSTEAL